MDRAAASGVQSAVLMCHAPIVIPAVAGPRAAECVATTAAMRQAAQRVVDAAPDVLVVLSPHTPRLRRAFGLVRAPISGSFVRFGAPEVRVALPTSEAAQQAVLHAANHAGVKLQSIDPDELDHGAAVPLHFVSAAGFVGDTLLLALPWRSDHAMRTKMGQAIAAAALASGGRWTVLASGDMSHCLMPGAPSGHHPDGKRFDAMFTERVAAGDLRGAAELNGDIRDNAAEDVVDTVDVASAAFGYETCTHEVLSYEGPFGVGYLVAVLVGASPQGGGGSHE